MNASMKIGRYVVERELGRGGMAVVYLARDPSINRQVAIKVLSRKFLSDPQFRIRFQREAETIAALDHPAIVPIYDFGEHEGQPFIVMRYMTGGSLSDRLRQGPMPPAAIIGTLQRIGPALDEAHRHKIVHRDLKPDNVLFDRQGQPYLADFGIVKRTEEADVSLTVSGGIIGTPAYMSPEQVEGSQELDGRSDIYSLGVIVFQMLTGKRPYESDTMMRLAMMHLLKPVPQLQEANPAVPQAYQGVIDRAMAKKPADRYPTAAALTTAVMEIARPKPPAPVKPVKRGFLSGPLLIAGGLIGGLVIMVALVAFIAYSMDLFPGGAETPPDSSNPITTLTDSAVGIQETDIANEPSPAPSATVAPAATAPPEPSATPEPSDMYIQYVLDASNSMLEVIGGDLTKLEVGRNALAEHWQGLQFQPNLGLRAFGHRFSAADQVSSCQDTELLAAPAQGQVDSLISLLFGLQAQGLSPLSMALREVPGDFSNVPERTNAVILIADSGDNCGLDPCQTIRNQVQGGIRYPIFVAGLGVEEADRDSLICLAENSGGLYLDVADKASLISALNSFVEELESRP